MTQEGREKTALPAEDMAESLGRADRAEGCPKLPGSVQALGLSYRAHPPNCSLYPEPLLRCAQGVAGARGHAGHTVLTELPTAVATGVTLAGTMGWYSRDWEKQSMALIILSLIVLSLCVWGCFVTRL